MKSPFLALLLLTATPLFCGLQIHEGDHTPAPAPEEKPLGAFVCVPGTSTFVVVSGLIWKTQMTDSWVTSRTCDVSESGISSKHNDQAMQFDCNPGFKIGVGTNFSKFGWSTFARWTYMHTSPSATWHSDSHSLSNLLAHPVTESATYPAAYGSLGANKVHADWGLNFNAIDAELGKNFQIAPNIMQRAFGCLRVVSVNSKLTVTYSDLTSSGLNGSPGTTVWPDQTVQMKNQAWLIGPRIGLNNSFGIFGDFGILATVATSIFIATDSPKYIARVSLPGGAGPVGVKAKAPQTLLRPGFDAFLGMNWSHCFPGKMYLSLTAGYEAQYFSQAVNPYQSLNMYGFTFTSIIDF